LSLSLSCAIQLRPHVAAANKSN